MLRLNPGVLFGLAAIALVLPANIAVDAQPSAPGPVTINMCEPILRSPSPQESPSSNPLAGLLQPSTSAGMRIEFTNESNKTATLVNFDVNSNGQHFVIRDVGTFSPGVSINHSYRNGKGQAFVLPAFIAPHVSCRVASVRFTDRSVWPPEAVPAPQAAGPLGETALWANPATLVISTDVDSALVMVSSSARVAGFKETDNCDRIAEVLVSATAQTSAAYTVKPIATGACTARISDEAGRSVVVPIAVK